MELYDSLGTAQQGRATGHRHALSFSVSSLYRRCFGPYPRDRPGHGRSPRAIAVVGNARRDRLRLGARAIAALGAATLIVSIAACRKEPTPAIPKWEYRIEAPLDNHFLEQMNRAGGEGWEIISLRRVDTDERDFEEFKREFHPNNGATPEQFELAVRLKLPKMKYEVVMKRSTIGAVPQ